VAWQIFTTMVHESSKVQTSVNSGLIKASLPKRTSSQTSLWISQSGGPAFQSSDTDSTNECHLTEVEGEEFKRLPWTKYDPYTNPFEHLIIEETDEQFYSANALSANSVSNFKQDDTSNAPEMWMYSNQEQQLNDDLFTTRNEGNPSQKEVVLEPWFIMQFPVLNSPQNIDKSNVFRNTDQKIRPHRPLPKPPAIAYSSPMLYNYYDQIISNSTPIPKVVRSFSNFTFKGDDKVDQFDSSSIEEDDDENNNNKEVGFQICGFSIQKHWKLMFVFWTVTAVFIVVIVFISK
jgi:hypothetical protein